MTTSTIIGLVRPLAGATAAVALVGGLSAGLARTGSMGSVVDPSLHGPLLVLGFFGVVIGVERAVGLRRSWAWAAPGLAGLSVVAALVDSSSLVSPLLATGSGVALCAVFATAWRIQPQLYIGVMATGAASYLVASILWLIGVSTLHLVPWLAGFLVLTIGGERLELTRLLSVPRRTAMWLVGWVALFLTGATWAVLDSDIGSRVAGIAMVGLALWLLRHDVARRTVRLAGVTRFMGVALLAGYLWLAVSGVIWMSAGLSGGGLIYDAGIHSLFLGFVMSMVFAHAPVVVPSVTRLDLPYHPTMWIPLALLHAGVTVRVVSDLAGNTMGRRVAGDLNVAAFVVFGLVAGTLVLLARRSR